MKRILMIGLALLFLVPATVTNAHSKLTSAIPGLDAVINSSPESIELTFDTRIEKLSKFTLYNAAGEEVETEKASVDGDTMVGKVPNLLPNGEYTVKWNVIGADGHAVNGSYTFTVNAPLQEETPVTDDPEPTEAAAPDESSDTPHNESSEAPKNDAGELPGTAVNEPTPEPGQNADDITAEKETTDNSVKAGFNYTPIIIVGVVIVLLIVIFSLRKRK